MKLTLAASAALVLASSLWFVPAIAQDSFRVAAAGSCAASYKLCVKRCRGLPNPSCVSEVCGGKLEECNSSGCWQDAPRFGGQKTCGLRRG